MSVFYVVFYVVIRCRCFTWCLDVGILRGVFVVFSCRCFTRCLVVRVLRGVSIWCSGGVGCRGFSVACQCGALMFGCDGSIWGFRCGG